MYKLTDKMIQQFEKDLNKFHELFQGGRCQAWQLEELIAKAIRSDFTKNEKVVWKGNGHDIGCDILINDKIEIQIKSGFIKNDKLILSGHRLTRFNGNFKDITNFLNKNLYSLITVPYETKEDSFGQSHIYQIFYLENSFLKLESDDKWTKKVSERKKLTYFTENSIGVEMAIYPSMSWQIWWYMPLKILNNNKTRPIIVR